MSSLSRVRLFVTPWTVAYKAPLSMGFSRQEYWRGLPFPSPGELPNPGIEPWVSCLGRQILYHWTTWVTQKTMKRFTNLHVFLAQGHDNLLCIVPILVYAQPIVKLLGHVWLFVTHGLQPTRLLCPWDFPAKNTGMVCHFLLQGNFLTQGSNPHLLNWQADSLPSEPPGKPVPFFWPPEISHHC